MTAFFWILVALLAIQYVAKRVRIVGGLVKDERRPKERFATQCRRARLRRETESTGVVHHEYDGHHYVAVAHSLTEVPALYLSMRRMMMEIEGEREVFGEGGTLVFDGKDFPVREWKLTRKD